MRLPRLPSPRQSGNQQEWAEALVRVLQGFMQDVNGYIGDGRHVPILFQRNGVGLGTTGTADIVNFVGPGVTVTRSGNVVTVTIAGGGSVSVPILLENGLELWTEAGTPLLTE